MERTRALVTGASRGIGAATARALAAMGHHVIVNYRVNAVAAQQVKDSIEAAGGSAEISQFDVANADMTSAAITELLGADRAPICVVVNNAGVIKDALLPVLKPEDWYRVTRTTLDGFFNVTRPLVMPMVRRRFGRIINIASTAGITGNPGQTNYAAAKAGLIGATKSLAREVARKGVTVNAVAPGLIDTDMIKEAPLEQMIEQIPMRRLGTADEVAQVVVFLASTKASYVTGQVIGVNGGVI
jgi:3-oxoacyl-[acyl-carrier protein] reductase